MIKNQIIYTIGHSTLDYPKFIRLLTRNKITLLVDIRSFPGSRFVPQYNKGHLSKSLLKNGIKYVWLKELGGRRYGLGKKSPNICWKNKTFRGYADYMLTREFKNAIKKLLTLSTGENSAILCAEALYWRCHRNLVSDYLKSKGIKVIHIMSNNKNVPHKYTECARLRNGVLSYF